MSPSSTVPASASGVNSRLQTLVLALCLALSPAVGIGFGRFAYALVLPAMKSDLGWTFSQAGMMGTANALGYFLGAVLTGPALRVWNIRSLLLWSLSFSVFALWGAAMTHDFGALLFFRALVGFMAAPSFICAAGLATRLGSSPEENALAMGITICGGGIGTILTGTFVPVILGEEASHWPRAWGFMGALGILALVVVALASRSLGGASQPNTPAMPEPLEEPAGTSLTFAYVSYFAFGMGYIAYMTFLIAFVRGLNASTGTVAAVWVSMGAAMAGASWIWKTHLARNRGGQSMALMGVTGAVCALLPLTLSYFPALTLPILLVSAIGFGATTMPVVTAITVLIRRHLPAPRWNGAIASATVIFAIGQSLGPVGAGLLSDHFGSSASLWWSATILGCAALIALQQKPNREN